MEACAAASVNTSIVVRAACISACTDVDECETMPSTTTCKCKNTLGSYTCDCEDGFVLKDNILCEGGFTVDSSVDTRLWLFMYADFLSY